MNHRDNLLRAVRFETPETIPMVFVLSTRRAGSTIHTTPYKD